MQIPQIGKNREQMKQKKIPKQQQQQQKTARMQESWASGWEE